ncbi:kynurenine formamidase [Amaricoccus macauensis]|uniref:Kynurenine formamidase n=1 Tax=Amaricoccus macauensis TaxID=57001 RepID=A0A840SQA9_9RHOB|nr:cyclase family protein [Amaricoccus macauensis]MBB5221451.1 kynurenine formamidase [Amaricoccus macauensis]
MSATALADLAAGLVAGSIEVVDLTAPLGPDTPILYLPPEIGKNTPPVKVHPISHYDENGPYWAWNWIELGEHTGTHFDAPVHWITGQSHANATTDTIAPKSFVAPANVIDVSAEVAADPDYLLTPERVTAWEAEHGAIEPGSWVLLRTDWHKRNGSSETFLNADETGPHSPGPTAEAIALIIERGAIGWGVETVGTDAGSAAGMTPPFPAHNLMHAANRYGLASLVNLDRLPPKGAVLIAAPLKFVDGTGSPVRALALVTR